MPHQNGLIYKDSNATPKRGVSIADVQQTLGLGYNDIGRLVTSSKVNAFSKVHPQYINHIAPASATERATAKYGLSIPEYQSASSLFSGAWTYNKGSWYRLDDFDGYYHYAPIVLTCPVNRTIIMNSVDETHDTAIPFYVFSLGGDRTTNWLYNRAIDEAQGVGSADAVSSTYRSYCLSIEDLTTSRGSALINNSAYLGLALFDANGNLVDLGTDIIGNPKNPIVCSQPLKNNVAQRNNDMFILPESKFTSLGTFTAVPCIRLGTTITEIGDTALFTYVPLCKHPIDTGTTYPCKFTVKVGGVDFYSVAALGVATSATGTPVQSLTTTLNTLYLFVSVTNNSGKSSYTSPNNTMPYWLQKPQLTANVEYGDGTTWSGSRVADTSLVSPSSAFTIPDGGSQVLIYRIQNIWNSDPTQAAKVVETGTVGITQHLYFWPTGQATGEEFGASGISLLINITYGL